MHGKFAVTDSPEAPLVILKVIELLNSVYPVGDDVVRRHDPSSTLSFLSLTDEVASFVLELLNCISCDSIRVVYMVAV